MSSLHELRNFGILAHIDAGKTTVSERILFATGVEHRMGEVHDGTATMDWMEEERERGITITAAVTHCPWRDHELQLIDTPGHVDFTAEVVRSLRVLDGAVVVLDGVAGVQAQTETVVRRIREQALPFLILVNKLDRTGADFAAVVGQAQAELHPGVVALQLPIYEEERLVGLVDLIEARAWRWGSQAAEMAPSEMAIPDAMAEVVAEAREELCARAAEGEEVLEDRFLSQGALEVEELREALRRATLARRLVPALAASALHQVGILPLLDAIVDYLPAPNERPPWPARDLNGRPQEVVADPAAPTAALAFKLQMEAHGELVYLRVMSGTVHEGEALLNSRDGSRVKLQPLLSLHADHRERVASAGPGCFIAIQGAHGLRTGDTLCDPERPLLLAPTVFPEPVIAMAVEAREGTDHGRLEEALQLLTREDPTLHYQVDEDSGVGLLSGMGELHLEVATHRLQRDFKLPLRIGQPQVKLSESVAAVVPARGWVDLPSDPPQRLEIDIVLEPQEEERPTLALAPGLPTLPEGVVTGLLAADFLHGWTGPLGYPLAQLKLWLKDWRLDPPQPAPTLAGLEAALQNALSQGWKAGSLCLEPRMRLRILTPDSALAAVLADLQQRQADIQSMESRDGWVEIHARAAMGRLLAYSTALRSQTRGRGEFHLEPDGLMPQAAVSGPE